MKPKKPDQIIRVGDAVRIKPGAKRVKRVGYPLDYREVELPEEWSKFLDSLSYTKYREDAREALLKHYVASRQFGGRDRTVHFWEGDQENFSSEFDVSIDTYSKPGTPTVMQIKYKKTGIYDPPSWTGLDPDTGCLHNENTVKIVQVDDWRTSAWYLSTDLEKLPQDQS
jgi:hypothetical protein